MQYLYIDFYCNNPLIKMHLYLDNFTRYPLLGDLRPPASSESMPYQVIVSSLSLFDCIYYPLSTKIGRRNPYRGYTLPFCEIVTINTQKTLFLNGLNHFSLNFFLVIWYYYNDEWEGPLWPQLYIKKNKETGVIYAYGSTSYWDKEK